jgi:hypothetical protein
MSQEQQANIIIAQMCEFVSKQEYCQRLLNEIREGSRQAPSDQIKHLESYVAEAIQKLTYLAVKCNTILPTKYVVKVKQEVTDYHDKLGYCSCNIEVIPTEKLRAILKTKADQYVQLTAQIDFTEQHLRILPAERRADVESKLEEIKEQRKLCMLNQHTWLRLSPTEAIFKELTEWLITYTATPRPVEISVL